METTATPRHRLRGGTKRAVTLSAAAGAGAAGASGGLLLEPLLPAAPGLLVAVALLAAGIPLAITDARTHTLPNSDVGHVALASTGWLAVLAMTNAPAAAGALLAGAGVFGAYVVMGLVGVSGFGDAKFAGALAALLGASCGLYALYLPLVALMVSVVQSALYRAVWPSPWRFGTMRLPHGPALVIAAVGIAAVPAAAAVI